MTMEIQKHQAKCEELLQKCKHEVSTSVILSTATVTAYIFVHVCKCSAQTCLLCVRMSLVVYTFGAIQHITQIVVCRQESRNWLLVLLQACFHVPLHLWCFPSPEQLGVSMLPIMVDI